MPAQSICKGPTVCGFRLPQWLSGKESACQCRRCERRGFYPWVGKIPWRRKWQPTVVFLPGEAHGQRGLVGYSPGGCKASDTTEHKRTVCGFSYLIASPGFFSAKYDNIFGITFIRDNFPKHGYPGVLRRSFGLGSSAESSGGFPTFRSQSGLQKGEQATPCTQQSGQETKSCLHLPSCRQTDGTSHHAELLFLEVSKESNWIYISSSCTISHPSPYTPN